MKVANLTCWTASGKLIPHSEVSLAPVLEMARIARNTGMFNGEPIVGGIVQADWKPMPPMRFKCVAGVAQEPVKKGKKPL